MNDPKRKKQQINDLVRQRENLPEIHTPHPRLVKPLYRMEHTARLARWAMDAGSDAYLYTVLKLITTVEQAERLKEMFAGEDMPPYAEAAFCRLTEMFMAYMEAIPQWVSAKLFAELERDPVDLDDQSVLSKLRAWLNELIERR
jgi:hypothetical protein